MIDREFIVNGATYTMKSSDVHLLVQLLDCANNVDEQFTDAPNSMLITPGLAEALFGLRSILGSIADQPINNIDINLPEKD